MATNDVTITPPPRYRLALSPLAPLFIVCASQTPFPRLQAASLLTYFLIAAAPQRTAPLHLTLAPLFARSSKFLVEYGKQ